MPELFIGVDIAKDWLDVFHPQRGACRIDNTARATRRFARACVKDQGWVLFEAGGGCDRILRDALEAAGAGFSRVNPGQAPDFAKALGWRAIRNSPAGDFRAERPPRGRAGGKTDRTDARMPAEVGARMRPAQTAPVPVRRRALQALATRRRQLVEIRKQKITRLPQTAAPAARADIRSLIVILDRRIKHFATGMAGLIRADPG